MTVRQYIGARYVPKFFENPNNTSEWLPNVIYEPLTIVTYGANSYTSKKTVPASIGNPADNPIYWVATANFNAYIEELQSQIDNINNDVEDLDGRIDDLEEKTGTFALYVGNSYATGVDEVANNGIFYRTKQLFDDALLLSRGGVGFTDYDGEHKTFLEMVQEDLSTSFDKSKVTHIVVISAMGDTRGIQANTDIASAVSAFSEYCYSNFENLKEIVLDLAEIRDLPNLSGNLQINLYRLNRLFEDAARANKIRYIGWTGWVAMYNSTYTQSDHYHPSNAGTAVLSQAFIDGFYGNFKYEPKRWSRGATLNVLPSSSITLQCEFTPYEVLWSWSHGSLQNVPSSYTAVSANSPCSFTFGSAPADIPPSSGKYFYVVINCNIDGTGKQLICRISPTDDNTNGLVLSGIITTALNGSKSELGASNTCFAVGNWLDPIAA